MDMDLTLSPVLRESLGKDIDLDPQYWYSKGCHLLQKKSGRTEGVVICTFKEKMGGRSFLNKEQS